MTTQPSSTAPVCEFCREQFEPSPGGSFPPVWVHACRRDPDAELALAFDGHPGAPVLRELPGPWEPCDWHETGSHEPCPCDGGDRGDNGDLGDEAEPPPSHWAAQ